MKAAIPADCIQIDVQSTPDDLENGSDGGFDTVYSQRAIKVTLLWNPESAAAVDDYLITKLKVDERIRANSNVAVESPLEEVKTTRKLSITVNKLLAAEMKRQRRVDPIKSRNNHFSKTNRKQARQDEDVGMSKKVNERDLNSHRARGSFTAAMVNVSRSHIRFDDSRQPL